MMDGVVSGKTGFTGGAGYSYVAALEDGGRHFTIALLACGWPPHKTYKWSDAKNLFLYGKEHYEKRDVYQDVELKAVTVENGIPQDDDLGKAAYTELTLDLKEEDKKLEVLMREEEKVQVKAVLPDKIKAPVHQGEVVGSVTYSLDDMEIRSYPVYANDTVEKISLDWCIRKTGSTFLF
jgi:D-alanyl-D-alanine carboxypeptidase (penicillin-binding protein 5/6)